MGASTAEALENASADRLVLLLSRELTSMKPAWCRPSQPRPSDPPSNPHRRPKSRSSALLCIGILVALFVTRSYRRLNAVFCSG